MQPPNHPTAIPNELPSGIPGEQTVTGRQWLDTPRKPGTPRSTKDLTEHRSEILIQMRSEMIHCTGWGETGFDHYLPFEVPVVDIDAAVTALKAANLVDPAGRFTSFPVSPSKIGTVNEQKRYEPLVAISDVLQKLRLSNGRKASCQFMQQPDNFNEAETYGANFKIDALLKLKRSTMPPSLVKSTIHVADLAVPSEYKTFRKNVRENRKQLLGTTNYCMNDDPRRKHIYGITIEDDTMAVWYFSRSHSAKSPDFNFTQDCRMYIRVMLALMFATEEELGYDPTIQRRLDPDVDKLCFVYKVNDRYYKTQKAIFDHRCLCITGRATRVWEVIEVASFDELQPLQGCHTVVLKDVWLDAGSTTERDIQQELFADLNKIADALKDGVEPEGFDGMDDQSQQMLRDCLLARDWGRYFLTVVDEWQGVTSKEVAEAAKPDLTLFGAIPGAVKTPSFPQADLSRMTLSDPSSLVPHNAKSLNRRHCPKRQSRVIFKEVGVPLHDVSKLGDAVTALLSCVFALQLMFLAGWVHRDVSSGNTYRFEDNGGEVRGILADLEYAKRFRPFDGRGSSDPKTGTAFFMAVEIQKQIHLYIPRISRAEVWSGLLAGKTNRSMSARRFVVHNFEHDMESVFWLLLWTLLVRFPCKLQSGTERSELAGILSEIFEDTSMCNPRREEVFTQDGLLDDILTRFLAPELKPLQTFLDPLRQTLVDGYLQRAYNFDDLSSYSTLYPYLRLTLTICQRLTQDSSLPDLLPCRSLTLNSNAAQDVIVKRPLQVKKRTLAQSNAGGHDHDYISSKAPRKEGVADVASSRTLRATNPGVSYVESDDGLY